MRIERVGTAGVSRTRRSNKVAAKGGGSFSDALAGSADATESVARAAVASPVTAILAAQEVPDASQGRSRGLQRGQALLEELEELHHALVLGTLSVGQVERLALLASRRRETVEDPRLAELLNEIEIRAAVELAKHQR